MATLQTCFDIETAMNNCCKTILSSSFSSSYGRDFSNIPRLNVTGSTPQVLAKFVLGQPTGHYGYIYNSGGVPTNAVPDTFDGELFVSVETERTKNGSYHSGLVSLIRSVLIDPRNYNTGSRLPYHGVLDVYGHSSNTAVEVDSNKDITNLQFSLRVCINPTAFPIG